MILFLLLYSSRMYRGLLPPLSGAAAVYARTTSTSSYFIHPRPRPSADLVAFPRSLQQTMNGWPLNKDPYKNHMGKYFNLDVC